jgi:hypothetical protein
MRATLLTLAPSTDAFRSLRPGCEPGFLSWGCPKIAPPSFEAVESVSREDAPERSRSVSSAHRGGNADSHPRSALVVSHHLGGLLLRDPAAMLQAAADPGVHRVSIRRETDLPAVLLLPSEAFPPPTATGAENLRTLVRITGATVSGLPFTANLAPSSFLLPPQSTLASRGGPAGTSRPCSIVGSVADPAVSG